MHFEILSFWSESLACKTLSRPHKKRQIKLAFCSYLCDCIISLLAVIMWLDQQTANINYPVKERSGQALVFTSLYLTVVPVYGRGHLCICIAPSYLPFGEWRYFVIYNKYYLYILLAAKCHELLRLCDNRNSKEKTTYSRIEHVLLRRRLRIHLISPSTNELFHCTIIPHINLFHHFWRT